MNLFGGKSLSFLGCFGCRNFRIFDLSLSLSRKSSLVHVLCKEAAAGLMKRISELVSIMSIEKSFWNACIFFF